MQHLPDSTISHAASVSSNPFLSGDETVVLVHGWDMLKVWKTIFAETAFKRLYWQGFRGKFLSFEWPTFTNAEAPQLPGYSDKFAGTYNASELQALRSGRALMNFLSSLPPDKTHLLAHSMGNVVAAEALRLWSQQSVQRW